MNELKFSCSSCGQHIQADRNYQGVEIQCPSCHARLLVPTLAPDAPTAKVGAATPRASVPGKAPAVSGLAKASLVLSAASLLLGPFGFIPGIVCGHMAKARIRRNSRLGGRGIATAGLVVGYGFFVLSLVMVGIVATMVLKTAGRIQQQTKAAMSQGSNPSEAAPAAAMMAKGAFATDGAWKTNLAGVSIPNTPISGRVRGMPFVCDHAELSPATKPRFLTLKQGEGLQGDVKITVIAGNLEGLEGQSLVFATTAEIPADVDYRVEILRRENGGYISRQFSRIQEGFVMRLECQQRVGDRIKGKIYLCFGDDQRSYIAGSFDATVR